MSSKEVSEITDNIVLYSQVENARNYKSILTARLKDLESRVKKVPEP
jgi:hypothetical protein